MLKHILCLLRVGTGLAVLGYVATISVKAATPADNVFLAPRKAPFYSGSRYPDTDWWPASQGGVQYYSILAYSYRQSLIYAPLSSTPYPEPDVVNGVDVTNLGVTFSDPEATRISSGTWFVIDVGSSNSEVSRVRVFEDPGIKGEIVWVWVDIPPSNWDTLTSSTYSQLPDHGSDSSGVVFDCFLCDLPNPMKAAEDGEQPWVGPHNDWSKHWNWEF